MSKQKLYDDAAKSAAVALSDFLENNSTPFRKNYLSEMKRNIAQDKLLDRTNAMLLDNNFLFDMSNCLQEFRWMQDKSSESFRNNCKKFDSIYGARENFIKLTDKIFTSPSGPEAFFSFLPKPSYDTTAIADIKTIYAQTSNEALIANGPLAYRLYCKEVTAAINGKGKINADTVFLCIKSLADEKNLLQKYIIKLDDTHEIALTHNLKKADIEQKLKDIESVTIGLNNITTLLKNYATAGRIAR